MAYFLSELIDLIKDGAMIEKTERPNVFIITLLNGEAVRTEDPRIQKLIASGHLLEFEPSRFKAIV